MVQSSCLCGANVITFSGEPDIRFKCHCTDERKLTGAAFSLNAIYSDADLKIIKGSLKVFTKVVNSGNRMSNHVCGECGSLLYRSSTGYPGKLAIKVGCVDDEDMPMVYVPDVEIFTRSRVPWEKPVEGAIQNWGDFGTGPAHI
ncbi:Mss4-like protein [Bisporella sp. PMI_857]|nr:Mss4-like protein [Bisporella sp. PMI_857]